MYLLSILFQNLIFEKNMGQQDMQKKKSISELKDLDDLAQLREKKKIQNDALKKIVDNLNFINKNKNN